MTGRFLITGCSGGGKSTLLDALAQRGYATVPERGRRIVAEAGPMPWDDPAGFARLIRALADIGYNPILLPKVPVADRVDFVMGHMPQT